MDERDERIRNMAYAATFAAMTGVASLLAVPIGPVPITLQTLFVLLTGYVLGARWGFTAILLYLLLGAAGLPVYAGGGAGLGHLFGPTAGYLFAFPIAAAVAGWFGARGAGRSGVQRLGFKTAGAVGGYAVVYALGVAQLMNFTGMGLPQAVATGVAPFLVTVPIEAGAAIGASEALHRAGVASASGGPALRGEEERAFVGGTLGAVTVLSVAIPWAYASETVEGTALTGSVGGLAGAGTVEMAAEGTELTGTVHVPGVLPYAAGAVVVGLAALAIAMGMLRGLDERFAAVGFGAVGVASVVLTVAAYLAVTSWQVGAAVDAGYGLYLPALMGVAFVGLAVHTVRATETLAVGDTAAT
jgi:biotin transport system substrate-specific component